MSQLYKLSKKDIKNAANVFAEAFCQYILYVPVIENQTKRKAFLHELYTMLIKVSLKYGKVFATSSNFEGVVMYTEEQNADTSFGKIIRAGGISNIFKMIWIAKFSGTKRFLQFSNAIDTIHKDFDKNNLYLQALAVTPEKQGQKFARTLINTVLNDCKDQNKGCYLETGDPKNVTIYEKYGFALLEDANSNANDKKIYYLHYKGL